MSIGKNLRFGFDRLLVASTIVLALIPLYLSTKTIVASGYTGDCGVDRAGTSGGGGHVRLPIMENLLAFENLPNLNEMCYIRFIVLRPDLSVLPQLTLPYQSSEAFPPPPHYPKKWRFAPTLGVYILYFNALPSSSPAR